MNDAVDPRESQPQIDQILKNAQLFLREKNYKRAAETVKYGLGIYPNQEKLLDIYSNIKNQYKNDKIQQLQDEAVMFMNTGAEDKAQEKLRQILQLDPSRTDLKHSLEKTRSERAKDYDYRVKKVELIRFGSFIFFIIVVPLCSVALWAWWSNSRCLKKSEELVASGNLYDARQELKKCGWFLAGKKQKISKDIQSAIDGLVNQAVHLAELKNFQKAKECLRNAAIVAGNSSEIDGLIKKYELLEQQQNEELAKQKIEQEKQRVLSEKALIAKNEFQKALEQSIENKADIEAKDALEIAKSKAITAENLFSQNQFAPAEKEWLSAAEQCQTAIRLTEKTRIVRVATLELKLKCVQASESALKVNASAEASEIWQEAEEIHNSAEQNFAQNNFDTAGNLWKQAAGKYDEARQAAMQSPCYKKALLIQKKWLHLKQGLSEEDVRLILGRPKCIQAASDHCIWYYQTNPTVSKIDEGNYECIIPQYGYVRFEPVNIETIIERNREAGQKLENEEQKLYENNIANLNKQSQEEDRRYNSFKFVPPKHTKSDSYSKSGQAKRDEDHQRREAHRAENQRHNNQIQRISNSIGKEHQRHQQRVEKLSKDLQTKIDILTNALSPRELRYIVSDWKLPDQDDLVRLLESEETEKQTIKPPYKWQMPVRWRSLRLNIKEDEAFLMLGHPNKTVSEPGKKIYCYGRIAEYGSLIFEECTDSFRRLRYWKEPLWDHIEQELKAEYQLSDPNQDTNHNELELSGT
ncbi:MAG: hypothetical protein CVV39_04515 [Planctomycetes bacterium HGW-Planctomycetes-1]|nr:MAG: hypothetical protein CVV39_04515 [Planctomycetes bacterium HGW-Planctomycetes-1]